MKKTEEEVDFYEQFEACVERVLGGEIRADEEFAKDFWVALVNKVWKFNNGREIFYSFRSAGTLIAEVRGEGEYIDWYCCKDSRDPVLPRITESMAAEGWTWEEMKEPTDAELRKIWS